jgi:hypothetical protein
MACVYVGLELENGHTDFTKLGMRVSWDKEEKTVGPELWKVSRVRFPLRAVLVAQKLITIEELRQ